jgi:hypothetical protein
MGKSMHSPDSEIHQYYKGPEKKHEDRWLAHFINDYPILKLSKTNP